MVNQRRIGPLYVVLAAALLVVLARACQVQVLQHGIWAGEAAAMRQSSEVLPYHRGRILDAHDVELARDEDQFEIRLSYRDFRRGSPIAQVAHARSTLEMRAVPLPEAEQHLEQWADEIVRLRPCELSAFAAGKALAAGNAPELERDEARQALRERRAVDLRYYAAELLELPPRQRACLTPGADEPEAGWSLLELAARARGLGAAQLAEELAQRLRESRLRLGRMAELLERDAGAPAVGGASALARLLGLLETQRREIEDDTADALFASAAGFAPGRVGTRVLEQRFDTAWIARALRWDDARRHEWIASRRAEWEATAAEVLLPRVLLRAQQEPIRSRRADRLLSELALLWAGEEEGLRDSDGQPRSWREFDQPCVLGELDTLYEDCSGPRGGESARAVLPFQSEGLLELAQQEEDRWRIVGALSDLARGAGVAPRVHALPPGWQPPAGPLEAARRWRRLAAEDQRLDRDAALVELSWLFFSLEARFQAEVERQLDLVYEQNGAAAPLAFRDERRSRAAEAERYLLLDRSTRVALVCKRPSWDLVQLVTRGAEAYAGFSASPTSVRLYPERDSAGVALAAGLVGSVRRPSLADLLSQSRERVRLTALRNQLVRSSEQESELRELALRLYRNDEWTGGTGVEGWLDKELRGQNGFQESISLSDEAQAADSDLGRAPVDGEVVKLTLDAGLQRAAQDTLDKPVMPNGDDGDQLWCHYPVGAIVLLTPEGDLLTAASAPGRGGLPPTPGRDDEHANLRERTLQMPTSNPPGSCFKPFLAAYALDRLHFDPQRHFGCEALPKGGYGYATIHCHGHHSLALRTALVESCNAYFGQLAEKAFTPASLIDMAHLFGFGEPTGLSEPDENGRPRLAEDFRIPDEVGLESRLADRAAAMRFACGLMPMEATPMQVARATAALATGRLPELRLVRSVGGREQPQRSRPLGISEEALRFVRDALDGVVNEPGGTANIAPLSERSLGFRFACKTGSADIKKFELSNDMTAADRADMLAGKWRKHAWIAGWFPASKPRAILVVYLHDVSETATKSAVWIAAQFLHQEAVRRFALGEDEAR
jgi:cell division protein FtsI/penicillin-binding protein 2